MAAVYAHLGLPAFAQDFGDVRYDAEAFDRRLGAPGLHRIRGQVALPAREPVLPPGLLARFAGDSFRHDAPNPHGVAVM